MRSKSTDRHFVKEELRRIRYANPQLNVAVNMPKKTIQDDWKPELVVEFGKSNPSLNLNDFYLLPFP